MVFFAFVELSSHRPGFLRFIDSPVAQPYQEREALGQNWLKNVENGKFFTETYVAHLDIPTGSSEDSLVVLLTTSRILLVKIQKLKVGWDVPLSDLQTISLETTGISAFTSIFLPLCGYVLTYTSSSSFSLAWRSCRTFPRHPRSICATLDVPKHGTSCLGVSILPVASFFLSQRYSRPLLF